MAQQGAAGEPPSEGPSNTSAAPPGNRTDWLARVEEESRRELWQDRRAWIGTIALVGVAIAVSVAAILFAVNVSVSDSQAALNAPVAGGDATGWLLTIVAVLISGVYVFTTFRIDRGVKTEARQAANSAAEKEVARYIRERAETVIARIIADGEGQLRAMEESKARHETAMVELRDGLRDDTKAKAQHTLDHLVDSIRRRVAGIEPVEDLRRVVAEIVDEEYRQRTFIERLFPGRKRKAKADEIDSSGAPKVDAGD